MGKKAMILAAGLGTRLKPLTDKKPKALIEWQGVPLLEHVLNKLKDEGFIEVIINIHHFARQITEFVASQKYFGMHIEFSDESEGLLDTGGAIKKASWFFDQGPFLVYNVDIQSGIDLNALYNFHLAGDSLVTLAAKERNTSRSLLVDPEGYLKGWTDHRSGEQIIANPDRHDLQSVAFSAIQIMSPEVINYFPVEDRFPLIPFYLELTKHHPVKIFRHDEDEWMDMGKLESYSG